MKIFIQILLSFLLIACGEKKQQYKSFPHLVKDEAIENNNTDMKDKEQTELRSIAEKVNTQTVKDEDGDMLDSKNDRNDLVADIPQIDLKVIEGKMVHKRSFKNLRAKLLSLFEHEFILNDSVYISRVNTSGEYIVQTQRNQLQMLNSFSYLLSTNDKTSYKNIYARLITESESIELELNRDATTPSQLVNGQLNHSRQQTTRLTKPSKNAQLIINDYHISSSTLKTTHREQMTSIKKKSYELVITTPNNTFRGFYSTKLPFEESLKALVGDNIKIDNSKILSFNDKCNLMLDLNIEPTKTQCVFIKLINFKSQRIDEIPQAGQQYFVLVMDHKDFPFKSKEIDTTLYQDKALTIPLEGQGFLSLKVQPSFIEFVQKTKKIKGVIVAGWKTRVCYFQKTYIETDNKKRPFPQSQFISSSFNKTKMGSFENFIVKDSVFLQLKTQNHQLTQELSSGSCKGKMIIWDENIRKFVLPHLYKNQSQSWRNYSTHVKGLYTQFSWRNL